MVKPHVKGVHAERVSLPRRPAFPQAGSELNEKLRPDRDHPDKQRNRRQSRRLFHENPQHHEPPDPEHRENDVPFLFRIQEQVVGQFEK
jgi:hypothetical protein